MQVLDKLPFVDALEAAHALAVSSPDLESALPSWANEFLQHKDYKGPKADASLIPQTLTKDAKNSKEPQDMMSDLAELVADQASVTLNSDFTTLGIDISLDLHNSDASQNNSGAQQARMASFTAPAKESNSKSNSDVHGSNISFKHLVVQHLFTRLAVISTTGMLAAKLSSSTRPQEAGPVRVVKITAAEISKILEIMLCCGWQPRAGDLRAVVSFQLLEQKAQPDEPEMPKASYLHHLSRSTAALAVMKAVLGPDLIEVRVSTYISLLHSWFEMARKWLK